MPQSLFIQAATQVVAFFAGTTAGAVATATTVYGVYVQAVAAVLQFVAYVGSSMAASKLLSPKLPSYSDIQDNQQMVRSPIAARQIIYGQAKVSGVLVYISTTGTKNEFLHMVIAIAGHEVEEIGDVYFNDELALTGAGSAAQGRFTGYAEIYKKLGSTTQTVETNLETATSGLTDGKWTSNHRLRGIAYLYVKLVWNKDVWTGGIPNVSAVVKGKKVYDPRSATTAYSANAALCLRDYLTDATLGMGMDSSEIDDTAVSAAANICDEQVQILPLSPTTYENRYEANGVLHTSATPDENIGKLASAMGGLIAYSGGKVVMYAAGYRIPTVSLAEKDFVGPISVQTRTSARDRVNAVKGVYVSPDNQWQPADFPSITSSTYLSEDNSIRYWRDVSLPMTTSPSCAQRLGVIELRRARQEITLTARFRLEAMQVRAGDTVMISNTKLGWSSKVFEVIEWAFVSEGAPPQLAVQMTLRETASTVYSWTVSDEVSVTNAPDTTLPDPFTLDAPTNLALVADGTTQLIQADGTALPRIKVSWSAPSEEFIQSGGDVVIEYKQGNSTTYLTWSRVDGDQTIDYISSDVRIGTTYDVRIFGLSYFGIATSYVSASVTVAKDTTAPATPTGLTAAVGTGKAVSLDWSDNTEADFSEYGVYRNTTGVTPATASTNKIAEVRASRFVDTEVTIGTTYYYWINAYDALENVSGFSSSVSAVPTYINGGSVDPSAPATPNAPTYTSETTYLASDGGSFARITLTAPGLSSGSVATDVLYRKNGSNDWIIANQISSSVSYSVSIDDLTPGVTYDFACRGISFSGALSTVSSTLTRLAPTNTTAPADPTGLTASSPSSSVSVPPSYTSAGAQFYAARLSWTASTSRNVVGYNIGYSSTFGGAITWETALITQPFYYHYTLSLASQYFAVRSVDRSGNTSAGTTSATNLNTVIKLVAGSLSVQDSTDAQVTGIKTGSGSSVRQVNAVYSDSAVVNLTGGALTETFNVSLTNRGFGAKPDIGVAQCSTSANITAAYDFDAAGNSSTNAVIRVTTLDGTNLPAGNQRFSIELTEYT